jgi:two-component system, OmpR family, phosphate regulon sensor histidine kinase PhoR
MSPRLRTHHKLFLSYSLLVAAVVVGVTAGVDATLRRPLLEDAAAELSREIALGREVYDGNPALGPDPLARHLAGVTGHRVTIIAADGTVLGDSGVEPERVAGLENHGGRPEVAAALATGAGTAVRFSTSVDADLLYAAALTGRGEVVRFAVGVERIDSAVARVRRQVLQVGGLALLLAAAFSFSFSFAVTRPLRRMHTIAAAMAAGDLSGRVRPSGRDELADLGSALDALADELQRRLGQLEAERGEMTALIDAMAEGVLAVAPDGGLRRANPAARRMFGLGDGVEGVPPEAVARRRPFLDLVRRALGGEAVAATELTHDGRHLLATAQPLAEGGAVLVFLDTSEVRRLEGVRRDFVANASHELKTPLTAIRGYSETLLDDPPAELRRSFAETIRVNAVRLQRILDDLLDLARIEAGGWPLAAEPVQVASAAEEAWQPFADAARARGVVFGVEAAAGGERVHADPGAFRQILTNLLGNAVRYTPDGGRIDVAASPLPGGEVRVEVRDTGSGIPAPHIPRIFERFYRVDPARSRAEGGTGLGLAIVRHLVERHGGRVEALSEPGRGTTIRFTLPAAGTPSAD